MGNQTFSDQELRDYAKSVRSALRAARIWAGAPIMEPAFAGFPDARIAIDLGEAGHWRLLLLWSEPGWSYHGSAGSDHADLYGPLEELEGAADPALVVDAANDLINSCHELG